MRHMTYAVRWCENGGPANTGGLLLTEGGLELTGIATRRGVDYGDLSELYFDRTADAALVLVTIRGDRLAIGSLQGLGVLHELADRVAAARGAAS
jgi:hypothetical protein